MLHAVLAVACDQEYRSTKDAVNWKMKRWHATKTRVVYLVSSWRGFHAQRIQWKQNSIFNFRILLSIAENRSANLHRSQGSRQQVLLQHGCTTMRSIYHELWAGRKRIRIDSGVFDQLHRSHRIRPRTARGAGDAIEVMQLAACKRMCLIRIWLLNFVLNILTIFVIIASFKILIEPVENRLQIAIPMYNI